MPKALGGGGKRRRAWLAVRVCATLLALSPAALAGETATPSDPVALPVSNPTINPDDGEDVPPPDSGSDSEEIAVVVELGEGREYLKPAKGPWVLAVEEAAPAGLQSARGIAARPDDPEWLRPEVGDGETGRRGDGEKGIRREIVIRAGDPEYARVLAGIEEADLPSPPLAKAVRTAAAFAFDAPRFLSGEGLDSDAAEMVAEIALAERQVPKKATEAAATPEGATNGEVVAVAEIEGPTDPASRLVSKLKEVAAAEAEGREDAGPPTGKAAGKKKKGDPVDPQKRFEEMIEQIKRNKDILNELAAKVADATVHDSAGNDAGIRVRDPQQARLLEVLRNNTPLGAVTGVVTDATGRQAVPARICITDLTGAATQAPLADGFYCAGAFSASVVSGPVKVEVTRGRFHAPFVQGFTVKGQGAAQVAAATSQRPALNFAARGWQLADLDIGVRTRPGEKAMWTGAPPGIAELALAARAEGVQILGVPVPWGEATGSAEIEALAKAAGDVLLLPVFPGPCHAFHGCGMGLGIAGDSSLPLEISAPETPLREAFEEIRARGGLAIYKELNGTKHADIRRDVFKLFPRLETSNYFGAANGAARLYAANELAFDTVAGPAYDALAFDGSPEAEALWFNLLNQGYQIGVIGAGGGSLEGGRLPYGQTFLSMDGEPTREKALEAIKNGRTGVTFGPAVFCKVLERDMGAGSSLPADGRRLTLQIQAYSSMLPGTQLDTIEIIRNGSVVHTQTVSEGESQIDGLNWPLSETATAWYVVRATEKRGPAGLSQKRGTAWSGAIYFRGPSFEPPAPVRSQVHGTLRRGLTPVQGTVTAVIPGQAPRKADTDANGRFKIELPASSSLIFESPGCEPVAQRIFEHPRAQRALGALQAERDGALRKQFERASLFPAWRLLLSDLEWDITLAPAR